MVFAGFQNMIRKNMSNVSHTKAGILNVPLFQHGQSTQRYHDNAQNANHKKENQKWTEEHLGAEDKQEKGGIHIKKTDFN